MAIAREHRAPGVIQRYPVHPGSPTPSVVVLEVRPPKKPTLEPVARLLVEREEECERDEDGGIARASIQLRYEVIDGPNRHMSRPHTFDGSYTRWPGPYVSLASTSLGKGAVFLDLPGLEGHRIGTYLMNEIVRWAKQWPEAKVYPLTLMQGQADADNKQRRNRFYMQFGITFDFNDEHMQTGVSQPINAGDLQTVDTWRANIGEKAVASAFREALDAAEGRALVEAQLESERRNNFDARQLLWSRVCAAAALLLLTGTLVGALTVYWLVRCT